MYYLQTWDLKMNPRLHAITLPTELHAQPIIQGFCFDLLKIAELYK